MTRDEVIAMAEQAGIDCDTDGDIWGSTNGALLKFADLVSAAERAACAKVCEDWGHECHGEGRDDSEAFDCADAIRARGEK